MSDFPIAVVADNVRRERVRRGWSLSELARRSGISKSTLSQVETAAGNPSLETMWGLANALDLPFAQLLTVEPTPVALIRAGDGPAIAAVEATYSATLLSAAPPGARRDIYRVDAQPGDSRHSPPHPRGTVEHVILCSGRAQTGPATEPVELEPGDYLSYPGDQAHLFTALVADTRAVLISEQR